MSISKIFSARPIRPIFSTVHQPIHVNLRRNAHTYNSYLQHQLELKFHPTKFVQTRTIRTINTIAIRNLKSKSKPPTPPEKQNYKFYMKHAGGCFFLAMFLSFSLSITFSLAVSYLGFSDQFMSVIKKIPNGYGEKLLNYCQEKAKKQAEKSKYFSENFSDKNLEILLAASIIFICLKPVKVATTLKLTQICFKNKQKKGVIDQVTYQMNKDKVRQAAKDGVEKRRIRHRGRVQKFKSRSDSFRNRIKSREMPRLLGRRKKSDNSKNKKN